jgi:3-oxoacyl-[acyl-carrier protein] reductase
MNQESRIALITGAAGGLGSASAVRLAQDGFRVVLVDREDRIHSVAQEINKQGLSADAMQVELTEPEQIQALVDSIDARHGRCDVLINNAGIHPVGRGDKATDLENTSLEDWNRAVAVNLTAPFLLCQALFPLMKRQQWGRIINVASRAGRTAISGTAAHYSATKSGLIGLTRAVAEKGAAHSITCNAIAPGRFPTPLADTMPPDAIAASLKRIPLGRVGNPKEFAATVAFLASEVSAYMTGAVLDVNGGAFMG